VQARSAIIFDCDGVLFDSSRANVAYYNAVLLEMGRGPLDPVWELRAQFLAAPQLLARLFEGDSAGLARAGAIQRDLDYGPFYGLMEPVPGLYDVLAELGRTHRLGMATNRGRSVGEVVRRFGLDTYLEAAVGIHDVARPKPHGDVIEACLLRLEVAPVAAVYVGDAESDLAAAHAAGVHFIAIGEHAWSPRWVRVLAELPRAIAALPLVLPPVLPPVLG